MFAHDFCRFLRPDNFIFRISQYESVSKSQSVSVKPRMCCRVLSVQNLCLKGFVRAIMCAPVLFWAVIFICSDALLQCKFICIYVFFVNILISELYI